MTEWASSFPEWGYHTAKWAKGIWGFDWGVWEMWVVRVSLVNGGICNVSFWRTMGSGVPYDSLGGAVVVRGGFKWFSAQEL